MKMQFNWSVALLTFLCVSLPSTLALYYSPRMPTETLFYSGTFFLILAVVSSAVLGVAYGELTSEKFNAQQPPQA